MSEHKDINTDTFIVSLKKRKNRTSPLLLIVEDQEFSLMMLEGLLSKTHEVITAKSGEEALNQYILNAPDIVFLDIELPRVSGHQVCELITKIDLNSFVVMVTANRYEDDVAKAKENKAKGFIAKPYTPEKIHAYIDKYEKEFHKKG